MPFSSVEEAVKRHPSLAQYSKNAQRAWVHAFNSAMDSGKDESSSFAVAWSAAKKADK